MASFSPGRRRSCLIFVGWTMRGKRELQPELKLKSQTRRTARCAFMPTGSIRPSDWSAARAILAGYNGILFVPFSTAPFPYCGPFPAQDISSGESHWASRSHICRSTILQELARIIRLTSFSTASGGQVRRMGRMSYQSRSGLDGRHTNDCLKGLKNTVAKLVCYRERSCSTATWFRRPVKTGAMERNMLANSADILKAEVPISVACFRVAHARNRIGLATAGKKNNNRHQ